MYHANFTLSSVFDKYVLLKTVTVIWNTLNPSLTEIDNIKDDN